MTVVDDALTIMFEGALDVVPEIDETESQFEKEICNRLRRLTEMYANEHDCIETVCSVLYPDRETVLARIHPFYDLMLKGRSCCHWVRWWTYTGIGSVAARRYRTHSKRTASST